MGTKLKDLFHRNCPIETSKIQHIIEKLTVNPKTSPPPRLKQTTPSSSTMDHPHSILHEGLCRVSWTDRVLTNPISSCTFARRANPSRIQARLPQRPSLVMLRKGLYLVSAQFLRQRGLSAEFFWVE